MNLKRMAMAAVMAVILLITCVGCGSSETDTNTQETPITFTDDLGREVELEKQPTRLISFGPSITEMLFALGLDDEIVGVTDFCDYPAAALDKPKVGNAFSPSTEKIIELDPDLVLTVEHEQLNSDLDSLGITYAVIDPRDLGDIINAMQLVGEITGREAEGQAMAENLRDTITRIADTASGAAVVKVFFILDATDPGLPWTAGSDSFIHDIIVTAGGENIAGVLEGDWAVLSIEEIVNDDPDIIIVQTMMGGMPTISVEDLEAHPVWGELRAVKQGNIFLIDGDLVSRPGPRIVEGLEEMAKIIHPELFD